MSRKICIVITMNEDGNNVNMLTEVSGTPEKPNVMEAVGLMHLAAYQYVEDHRRTDENH